MILSLGAYGLNRYFQIPHGLEGKYYANPNWEGDPEFVALDPEISQDVLRERQTRFPGNQFSIEWRGFIAIQETGEYSFATQSDDGSSLYINDRPVVDNGGVHGLKMARGQISVKAGIYPIRIRYFQVGGNYGLVLLWARGDQSLEPLPSSFLLPPSVRPRDYLFKQRLDAAINLLVLIWSGVFLYVLHLARQKTSALGIIIGVGITARFTMTLGTYGILWPDSIIYYNTARAILSQFSLSPHLIYHTPLYPLFLALFLYFGETPKIGTLVIIAQRILGLLSIIFFYKIAKKIFDSTVAFYSSLLFSLYTLLLYYETVVQTEVLFIFFLSLWLYATLKILEKNSWKGYFLMGILYGLLALTRPVAQFFILSLPLVLWFKAGRIRRIIFPSVLAFATYLAVISPWMFINHRTYGFWGLSRGQGLGLFYRVLDLDGLRPVENTRYPLIKRIYEEERLRNKVVYYEVKNRLTFKLGYSELEADKALFSFALETLRAHPYQFILNTFKQFYEMLTVPEYSIHICLANHVPNLCCKWTRGFSVGAFPNTPTDHFPSIKWGIHYFFTKGAMSMKVVLIFCLLGIIFYFSRRPDSRTYAILLLMTVGYFTLMPSVFNSPEDRYRLPIDALLFMFAVEGVYRLVRYLQGLKAFLKVRIGDKSKTVVESHWGKSY
ncbi:MAG TPA: PA14 domain-containing protein [Candidatus Limnocylindrales bacterium]|nr:PA14 domain-containing protein [Candidatus Limnocylindrales bacterium]